MEEELTWKNFFDADLSGEAAVGALEAFLASLQVRGETGSVVHYQIAKASLFSPSSCPKLPVICII